MKHKIERELTSTEIKILQIISQCYPYSFAEVKTIYRYLASYDRTIKAIEVQVSTMVPLAHILLTLQD